MCFFHVCTVLEVINRDTVRMLSQEIQNGKIARHDVNNDNDQEYYTRRKLCTLIFFLFVVDALYVVWFIVVILRNN